MFFFQFSMVGGTIHRLLSGSAKWPAGLGHGADHNPAQLPSLAGWALELGVQAAGCSLKSRLTVPASISDLA